MHTPGPWKVGHRQNVIVNSYGTILANCEFSHSAKNRRKPTGEQSIANARLIAAAPDLLEALKLVWSMFDDGRIVRNIANDGHPDWALKMLNFTRELQTIQTAIAKAEGA